MATLALHVVSNCNINDVKCFICPPQLNITTLFCCSLRCRELALGTYSHWILVDVADVELLKKADIVWLHKSQKKHTYVSVGSPFANKAHA